MEAEVTVEASMVEVAFVGAVSMQVVSMEVAQSFMAEAEASTAADFMPVRGSTAVDSTLLAGTISIAVSMRRHIIMIRTRAAGSF